ncbi:LAG1 longevity assurance homolog 2-like isoform X3 [Tripterygium wilfordii]|uniref:LAG1 longevity assurance homolog 2-like isoform X3 n=1 Tax=Tripterygium wilfordii TaxID=458696 RepID=UPI0018F80491|nr:LAG1 longevity assurance homolog 2-like isoform X3 [Tripterygium wilfordii]
MDSVWSNSSEPDAYHFVIALFFAVGFVVVRFYLDRFVFRRLALWLTNGAAQMKINEGTYAKVAKCSESMWKLTYYATVEAWILKIAYHEPWFRDTHYYFKGWPNQELKFIYGGSIVLALHDASDVFLEAAKVFKYSERELGASVCFGFFALSWLVLRLIFFPFCVIKTTSCISPEYVDLSQAHGTSLYYIINTMLLMLLMFHMYWWVLICSMIMRQLKNRGKVGEDIRSDSEDDD